MESIPMWQFISLSTLLSWIVLSSYINLTLKLRSLIQPWVIHHVIKDTPFILQIQRLFHCSFSDRLFSALSCVVSVPFYTAFLPFLFWSGHGKLARQMTLLIALCDYMGNCIKDVVSAPRPSSPPVRRVTDTQEEKGNVLEYGLPSSHTLNTVCLSGFLLHYTLHYTQHTDTGVVLIGLSLTFLFVGMMVVGRIYLGMHSVVDIIAGLVLGLVILPSWIMVHDYVDNFVVSGQNVTSFWVALSFLLLFAYPTPEFPTPSYEFHAAFDGVALGIINSSLYSAANYNTPMPQIHQSYSFSSTSAENSNLPSLQNHQVGIFPSPSPRNHLYNNQQDEREEDEQHNDEEEAISDAMHAVSDKWDKFHQDQKEAILRQQDEKHRRQQEETNRQMHAYHLHQLQLQQQQYLMAARQFPSSSSAGFMPPTQFTWT